jgi:hypothetical protein
MAVLIEAISVVVKMSALCERYPGGWEAFRDNAPNQTLCADEFLVRVGFMTPDDVESFVRELEHAGLVYLKNGEPQDLVVADQQRGFAVSCSWADIGSVEIDGSKVKACQATEGNSNYLISPDGWQVEGSLSQTYIFAPSEEVDKSLKFLRNEGGLDVYLNMMTGKEVFLGRTRKNVARPKSLERSVISRDQAYEIAKQDALDNELGFNVNGVFLPEEIASALPVIYGVPLENCWVAYIKSPEPLGLRSSIIIIVDRESGEVIYRGSANDEG